MKLLLFFALIALSSLFFLWGVFWVALRLIDSFVFGGWRDE